MSAKHTPGPWTDDRGLIMAGILPERRLPKRAGIGQQKRMPIASVSNSPEPHMLSGEAEANAALIAAAPELLAALKRIRDAEILTGETARQIAIAAIAKAEGRS